jgi:exosome complex component CSL4
MRRGGALVVVVVVVVVCVRRAMTTPAMPRWVCPGDVVLDAAAARAATTTGVTPGAGCAVCEVSGAVRATVCGAPKCATVDDDKAGAVVVVVERDGVEPVVPRVGDDVFGRVSRVDERQARVDVVAVNGRAPTGGDFAGVIRKQDVRATEIDKVELEGCFRAGDVVRAKVLSLGDARSFYLTTASDALGVVQARHRASREVMLPISWTEVQCPVTGEIEERKVAEITDS